MVESIAKQRRRNKSSEHRNFDSSELDVIINLGTQTVHDNMRLDAMMIQILLTELVTCRNKKIMSIMSKRPLH